MKKVRLNEPQPRGGAIKRRKGSSILYVDLYYFGVRVTKSTGLVDSPQNRAKVRRFLEKSMEQIEQQTFRFAEAFPGASTRKKRFFAEREGREFHPEPQHVLFGPFAREWMKRMIPAMTSPTKRKDYTSALEGRILPHFARLSFYQITSLEVQAFIASLSKENGIKKGKPLSRQRVANILIPLRRIWEDAADHHRWTLRNPFETISRHLPARVPKRRDKVFRFREWLRFLECAPPCYRPHLEFLVLTGLSASETAGLRKADVGEKSIAVQHAIVLGEEKDLLKNRYRHRTVPLTERLRQVVARAAQQHPSSPYLFSMEDGRPFDGNSFRKVCWNRALKESQVQDKTPYSTRHTFCAWALTIGMNPMRLYRLMGHSSKQMVYQNYGEYVEGLEDDAEEILNYFGVDFLVKPRKNLSPLLVFGDSYGDSRELIPLTIGIN
ncbi:tyrosine-type recombinase/integrase [Geobacter pickeringii]|uniref:tyrosine-type recombinase/integrase n=1 Tax=Geobacter pickeringii TaxID=345632 RepID=UPI00068C3F60|nr:tyrosine-type recombinase/integrase [Geobacter pickeringii]